MRISDADIAKAEQMDLLTYLQIYEPGNLKRVAGMNIEQSTTTACGSPMENGTVLQRNRRIQCLAVFDEGTGNEIPRCSAADPTAAAGGIPECDAAAAARKETGIFPSRPKLQS